LRRLHNSRELAVELLWLLAGNEYVTSFSRLESKHPFPEYIYCNEEIL